MRMRYTFELFREYLGNYIKTKLTYRADFWVEVVSDLMFSLMNLIFIFIVFQHTPSLGDWSEAEVVFVYGYFMIAQGVFSCFTNLWNFGDRYIIKGEMDRVLTRPAHSLAQVMLENVDPPSLIGSLVGLGIMGAAWAKLGLTFNWYDPIVLIVMVIGSVLIYTGLYTTLAAISFYSDSPTGIIPLMYNIQSYGRYPIQIYNKGIRFLLTWVLPFAFVGVYPASFFLERHADRTMAWLTPVVGLIVGAIGLIVWNRGVKRYRGAGS
ncbi:ABC-2 family transporter protein [Cohnella nanjingensis]|uniref:ABC-2 family transporter protein n=2 Tax=Cohnella nanjingensis TaxID=1387779 RepID=A0A7X0VEJ2_9BACL|nr:ABC-2 family transporter protein [Cohnella nanjingensis]MBB6671062.1 ABC-2 family transporter protein [Cohnella nanjingensis]